MSSFHPKEAPIFESIPCPECGEVQVTSTIETCRLSDGLIVKKLQHYKCQSCGARFFDDDAMHRIQAVRASRVTPAASR